MDFSGFKWEVCRPPSKKTSGEVQKIFTLHAYGSLQNNFISGTRSSTCSTPRCASTKSKKPIPQSLRRRSILFAMSKARATPVCWTTYFMPSTAALSLGCLTSLSALPASTTLLWNVPTAVLAVCACSAHRMKPYLQSTLTLHKQIRITPIDRH